MSINPLLSLGLIFLLGLMSSGFIRRIKFPAITAYLILGVIIGPSFLGLISIEIMKFSGLISNIVLSFIAFSMGQNFSRNRLEDIGNSVISLTLCEGIGAAIFVGGAIYLLTANLFYALTFASIAPATAPAAVVMVVRELRAKGRFTDTLLGIVALDDALGLMLFAFLLAIAKSVSGIHGQVLPTAFSGIMHGMVEIFGALVMGILLGWILSMFSRHVSNPSELLIYTLGFILLDAGLSLFLGLSVLLSNMAMSAMVININRTGFKFFDSVRNIDSPFYLLFFVLAGANLEVGLLRTMGIIGVVYILARMLGKITGIGLGARVRGESREIKNYLGLGLAPQAGVALGMAMIVNNVFPSQGSFIMSTIIATTVIYEIFGPLLTKYALVKSGNAE